MSSPQPSTTRVRRFPAAPRLIGGALAGLLLLGASGCYGRFPLTNAIYDWNGRVTDNHIVNSVIMIVLAILPVYGIAILVDAVIINSIEYWDGNTIHIAQTHRQPDGTTVVLAPGAADNEAILTVSKDDVILARRTFVRNEAGVTTIRDENGAVVSHVVPDGERGFRFTDADGKPMGALTEAQIAGLRANSPGDDVLSRAAFPPIGR